jgi:hypothetical protein
MIGAKASRVLYVFVLAIVLAAAPTIYFQARADNASGGSMSRTTSGCGAMMGGGMMGGDDPPNQQWRR